MPANLVKPGTEKYWQRAKAQAAKQGREGDWAYVTGIYKRMTVNKSEDGEGMEKAVIPAAGGPRYFIHVRQGGQVPSRDRLKLLAEASRPPKPATTARLLDSNKPIMRLAGVFEGLGLDPDAQASWAAMLGPVIESASNELTMRQAVYAVLRTQQADGALGSALLERALRYRRDRLQKSRTVELVTVDELRKGEARGGTYYRRTTGKNGRHRYFYSPEDYDKSKGAHLDGEGAAKRAIKGKVAAMLEKAGKSGVQLSDCKALCKRYGSKMVGSVLNEARDAGELAFKGGRLRPQARKGND